MKARIAVAGVLALLTALVLTTTASASEPLADGEYSVQLPGGATIAFTISNDGADVEFDELSGFELVEDDSSDSDTTKVTNGTITLEIKTGDDGKIEVEGVSLAAGDVTAQLPGTDDEVTIFLSGDDVEVDAPGFTIVDTDVEDDEVEVTITDGTRTFEIEVDLEDGSVEIKVEDDDSMSDDSMSDDEASEDDDSDDDSTETSIMDDSDSDDDMSDDDDSSDETTDSTIESTETTAPPSTTATTGDDDDSSDEDDESDDSSNRSNDDRSGDDDSSD